MGLARAELESLLRTRRLDRTLTTALPTPSSTDEYAIGPTDVTALDSRLRQWPVAGLSLVAVALSLGAAMWLRDLRW